MLGSHGFCWTWLLLGVRPWILLGDHGYWPDKHRLDIPLKCLSFMAPSQLSVISWSVSNTFQASVRTMEVKCCHQKSLCTHGSDGQSVELTPSLSRCPSSCRNTWRGHMLAIFGHHDTQAISL